MKVLICGLLLCVVGCGKSAPTQFETDLTAFVTEAKRFDNQVNLGMPELDRAQQGQKLRNLLAGLNPVTDDDKVKFDNARSLCKELELHSREDRLLNRLVEHEASSDDIAKVRNSFDARATEITGLFAKLETH
jgi:hypothetical protein